MSWFLERFALEALGAQNFTLPLGLTSLWFSNDETARAFLLSLGGINAPGRGRVLYSGEELQKAPHLRARVGLLLPEEPAFFLGATLEAHYRAVDEQRKRWSLKALSPFEHSLARQFLGALGPSSAVETLTAKERRDVILAQALSLEDPLLLALHDPLRELSPSQFSLVSTWLESQKTKTFPLLIVSSSESVASKYSERPRPFDASNRPSAPLALLVRTERPRDIAAIVSRSPEMSAAEFDAQRPHDLWLVGSDLERLAALVGEAAVETNSELFELSVSRTLPPQMKAQKSP